ncbi:hypothetical protein MAR_028012 [Mya arenaria]|uniref:YqaJ viral recombinase domain-containing protein n=1 Tax=Mya arenaria TaxID=6604 RepID=A0ABY7DCD2_MYAAR|nr:hypothetical protein MAR_028012 [Mya arenaria]
MHHGIQYEKEAIHQYESNSYVKVKPCGIFVSKSLPFLGTSPEGVVRKRFCATTTVIRNVMRDRLKIIRQRNWPCE